MISHFFLKRPVFAAVLSILIVLFGLVSGYVLPIEQYPNMTPPQIQVTVSYPGASAETLADSVAAPLETQINGVEDMIYMYSSSAASGALTLNIFFRVGADINQALNNVQNRVDLALPQIPQAAQKEGVVVKKETPTILMLIAVQDPEERYQELFVNNYTTLFIADELLRLPGVVDAKIINARNYAMRVWLQPDKMAQLGIVTSDIVAAISDQSQDYPLGLFGQPPTKGYRALTWPTTAQGRLATPEEFENIVLRSNPEGATVWMHDIADVSLGAQDYSVNGKLNTHDATLIAVYQNYGANALDVAASVKETLRRLESRFPTGIQYTIPFDTTDFIKLSIAEVKKTLCEAAVIVSLVIFLFLQNGRATLIPVVAMIVSIIGALSGMYLLGFTTNTLTLFGLVLAIGIVVDDAIVVVENVDRLMKEKGFSSREAAHTAMQEVTGPMIAIVCVLCAVFVPVSFLGGIAGVLYKQFAMTLSISVLISGICALTLSPVLAAYCLKHDPHRRPSRFAQLWNRGFERCSQGYIRLLTAAIAYRWILLMGWVGLCGAVIVLFLYIPTTLIPEEDQGYLFAFANLPDGESLHRTEAVTDQVIPRVLEDPAVADCVSITGFSLLENVNRYPVASYFITLKDWKERKATRLSAFHTLERIQQQLVQFPQGSLFVVNPPAIQGLGTVGGFEFWVINESDEDMQPILDRLIRRAAQEKALTSLRTSYEPFVGQMYADVDRIKSLAYGVPISQIYQTLQVFLGSYYVNNFNKYGHVFNVMVQAAPPYRQSLADLGNMYVRSMSGAMIPIQSLVRFTFGKGPNLVTRFNVFPAVKLIGGAAPGYSTSQSLAAMTAAARDVVPSSMNVAWSGAAYQEITTSGSAATVLIAALVFVFLILAALYERWLLPIAVLMGVPFALFGALLAILFRGLYNDVYFQIGLVTLVALSAKNAILIVEFALQRKKEGVSTIEAALCGAQQRFRAILMTSLTFVFGVVPLVWSHGAGAASRHSVGTGVMGGMIWATLLGLFFIPIFYIFIEGTRDEEK